MAGRPNYGANSNANGAAGDLLGLDDTQPPYNSGQRPPVHDNELLNRYDIDDSDHTQARPSTSYDDFVGGRPDVQSLPRVPYSDNNRAYSQTSDLDNLSRYHDEQPGHEDYNSNYKYYDAGRASDDHIPGGDIKVMKEGHGANRSSMMSMGGMVDRAKGMLGMREDYSDMNLPLTERNRVDTAGTDELAHHADKKKFGMSSVTGIFKRKKIDPATLGPRMISLNDSATNKGNGWVDNHISTAKYNVATFLPKFLYEQFSKYANTFFLFTAILQQIPDVSPTNRYTTIVPLFIVLLVSAAKELVEDYRRKASDNLLNQSKARILKNGSFIDTKWINVAVGDIVRVESEEPFPADIVLLTSS